MRRRATMATPGLLAVVSVRSKTTTKLLLASTPTSKAPQLSVEEAEIPVGGPANDIPRLDEVLWRLTRSTGAVP